MSSTTELYFVPDGLGAKVPTGGRLLIESGGTLRIEGTLNYGGTNLTSSITELNSVDGVPVTWSNQLSGTPTVVIGTEAGDVINVSVQLKDITGINPTQRRAVKFWLSDVSTCISVTGTAAGTIAIGTNGTLRRIVESLKEYDVVTNATGAFDVNITKTGAQTWYMGIQQGDILYPTNPITFA